MNQDTLTGNWNQFKGKVKEQWGKLTNDEIDVIDGKRDQLVGSIQKTYGKARTDVETEVAAFEKSCGCRW